MRIHILASPLSALFLTSFQLAPAPAGGGAPVDAKSIARGPAEGAGPCDPGPTQLCIPLDGTFSIVDFDFGAPPCERNDDGSSSVINLPFTFELYGIRRTQVWINNNGTLSFDGPFPAFAPSAFPLNGPILVAPFWSDVDTRGGGGTVWMRIDPNRLIVVWERVGYFNEHADRLNTYEVILTDGADSSIGSGNVCFSFDDMQWTTGDASGGLGGFGGAPATVGVNAGDGTEFFQLGLFDARGDAYDGPSGANDGVDYLDDSSFSFDVSGANVPPIFTSRTDVYEVPLGARFQFDVSAVGPESDQIVTITADANGLRNFACTFTPGARAGATCMFSPAVGQEGPHVVTFTATDDGDPVEVSTFEVTLLVEPGEPYCSGQGCPCDNNVTSGSAGCVNSTGVGGLLRGAGSVSVAADDLVLTATGLPESTFGIMYMGPGQDCGALGDGMRAVMPGPPLAGVLRFPIQNSRAAGSYFIGPGIAEQSASLFGGAGMIRAGAAWNFQAFYRDPGGPCGSGFSFSNGYTVHFTP